ncbi:MAG: ATP synthase F1 subunit delta [Cyanobacteria bacterium P01_H01_bin.15]
MKGSTLLSGQVVDPYAEALLAIAKENNVVERIGDDLRGLLALLDESPELAAFVGNPLIKPEDKKSVLERILGDGTERFLRNFLMLLVDRRRILFLDLIARRYLALLRKLNNVVLAEVKAATELTGSQRDRIVDKVKSLTGATAVELDVQEEADLIGGVLIKVGSQVFDASLKGQLRRIGMALGATGA